MKSMTPSEEAYRRLKSWKTDPSESFSTVVLKAVPKRGTAGDMDKTFDQLPKLTRRQAEAIKAEADEPMTGEAVPIRGPGPHDLWIAATALQYDIPLVTGNTAQFARVEGIQREGY